MIAAASTTSATTAIAQAPAPAVETRTLRSQLPGVTDAEWTRLVRLLTVQGLGDVSPSNDYGSFAMRVLRLADLGMVRDAKQVQIGKRSIWTGEFVEPMTASRFLANPIAQYHAFVESLRKYDAALDVATLPAGVSRSGALALLHRIGPNAIKSWARAQFEDTRAIFEKCNGIF